MTLDDLYLYNCNRNCKQRMHYASYSCFHSQEDQLRTSTSQCSMKRTDAHILYKKQLIKQLKNFKKKTYLLIWVSDSTGPASVLSTVRTSNTSPTSAFPLSVSLVSPFAVLSIRCVLSPLAGDTATNWLRPSNTFLWSVIKLAPLG